MSQEELSRLNLDDDFAGVVRCPEASAWILQRAGPLEIWATLSPSGCPDEKFQARLLWAEYPQDPPSLKFRDPASGRLDVPSAWPQVRGFRPGSLDACVNWCLEGFDLHPEWRNDPRLRWSPQGNALLRVLRILQDELNGYYQGRFRG